MMLNFYRPDNLNDGLVALSENSWTLLAGGTDFYPARVGKHLNEKVMDLTGIRELRSIRETEDQIYIGALTTHINRTIQMLSLTGSGKII